MPTPAPSVKDKELRLRAADGSICDGKPYQEACAGGTNERCCCYDDCSFSCCAEGQICQDHGGAQCYAECTSAADCSGDAGLGYVCIDHACIQRDCRVDSDCATGLACKDGLCDHKTCTSNRDCDIGQACSTSRICAAPLTAEPDPGCDCSSTDAGAAPSLFFAALAALGIAAARARRRPRGPLRTHTPR